MTELAFAANDTVYLKSGEKIEGRIYKEGGKNTYLITDSDVGLVTYTILQDDIEKIEYEQGKLNEDESAALVKRYKDFQNLYREGNKSFQKKDYYDAMASYRQAAELNPKFPELHYNLGTVYVSLGYSSKAKESFQAASQLAKLIRNPTEKEQEVIANIEKALQSLR